MLGIELSIPNTEEGPGYGSAMLAMVGSGKFESAKKCAKELVNIKETIQPDTKLTSLYAERYEKFKYIYPSVKELYKQIKK